MSDDDYDADANSRGSYAVAIEALRQRKEAETVPAATCIGETTVYNGDCLGVMDSLVARGVKVDSIVTDPPYHLTSIVKRFGGKDAAPAQFGADGAYARASRGFMGKEWDGGDIAFRPETWRRCYDLLKPGGHLIAFSGSRTYHRMACAIEDAGFEIRDQLMWLYGMGFPKSHDVSKAIDKAAGAERTKIRVDASEVRNPKAPGAGRDGTEGATRPWIEQALRDGFYEKYGSNPVTAAAAEWQGWGTALKPAHEPCVLARKPLDGTVAHNVLTHGVGAINIDACRVGTDIGGWGGCAAGGNTWDETNMGLGKSGAPRPVVGRFPANVIHDGSDEVFDAFAAYGEGHARGNNGASKGGGGMYGHGATLNNFGAGDSGTPARFFYSAKASAKDRAGSKHPTVKPISLIKYLATLVTPPGGLCLDPFAGSGTLGAAWPRSILIERDAEYHQDILRRLSNMGEFTAPCDEAVGQGDGGAQADLFGNAPPSAHREEKFTECSPMKNSNATGKP